MVMKVIFIGGLTNGQIVYDYLRKNRHIELSLAITYTDSHLGPRHMPMQPDKGGIKKGPVIEFIDDVIAIQPDLIVVAGWSEMIPPSILQVPKYGVIGFHPSRLPDNRGRSVLAWQIEEGYTETALTMFYYGLLPDSGDIIAQHPIPIAIDDYIEDILSKVDESTYNLMKAYFPLIRKGEAPRRKQDWNEGLFRRLRGPRDSEINWNRPAIEIYNKIRAISRPYPGAVCEVSGMRLRIWRAQVDTQTMGICSDPGLVIGGNHHEDLIVACRNSAIRLTEYEKII